MALARFQVPFGSPFLLLTGLAMLGGLFSLGWVYWFSIPFLGIAIALACYVASVVLSQLT